MMLPNFYFLLLYSEIITNVWGYTNLVVWDAISFCFQWLFHPNHFFMFIIVTYRDQKIFEVPIMSYINFVTYVQYKIDNHPWGVHAWAHIYVNDIICRAKSLSNLLKKLRILFNIFFKYNIFIKLSKSFFHYPNVRLLG